MVSTQINNFHFLLNKFREFEKYQKTIIFRIDAISWNTKMLDWRSETKIDLWNSECIMQQEKWSEFTLSNTYRQHVTLPMTGITTCCWKINWAVGSIRWISSGNIYHSIWNITSFSSSNALVTLSPNSQNMKIYVNDQNISPHNIINVRKFRSSSV